MTDHDFVYVIASGDRCHKIGVTREPAKRLSQLQVGHPHRLEIVFLVKTNRTVSVERAAHKALATHRLSGEWFGVEAEVAIRAVLKADRRFPPKPGVQVPVVDEDLPYVHPRWRVEAEIEEKRQEAVVKAIRDGLIPRPVKTSAVHVSLQLGPTRRAPGTMLKKR